MNRRAKIFLRLTFCAALASCQSVAAARGVARVESKVEAERLWELAVTAKGGRERLRAVRSLLVTTTRRNYLNVELYAFPAKFWRWSGEPQPFGVSAEMINGERRIGYLADADDPRSPIALGGEFVESCEYVNNEAQLYYLLETRWLKPEPVETFVGEVDGRCADVVRVRAAGRSADFYLDNKSHLPIKITFPSEGGNGPSILLKDYADAGGLLMPSKARYGRSGFISQSYQMNADYDEGVFERPPSVKAGPEAWKPKKSK